MRRSGARSPVSCCCCRTATRARARTTPRPGSSGSSQLCAENAMTVAQPSTPGVVLPPAAPAHARRGAQPDDRLHAEAAAAAQGGGVAAGGADPRHLPAGDQRHGGRGEPGDRRAGHPGLGPDRATTCWPSARRSSRTRSAPRSSGSSSSTRCRPRRSSPSWRSTRTRPRSAGSRTSPRTRARGRSWR